MTDEIFNIAKEIIDNDKNKNLIIMPACGTKKAPIYINGGNRSGWNDLNNIKNIKINEFKSKKVTGISLLLTHSKDVACFDLDIKTKKGYTEEDVKKSLEFTKKLINKKLPIYVEKSVSGEGIHIIFKAKKELLKKISNSFSGTPTQPIQDVEFFITNKQIIIYPSYNIKNNTRCEKLYNNIYDIKYLNEKEIDILINYLKDLQTITGEYKHKSDGKNGDNRTFSEMKELNKEPPKDVQQIINEFEHLHIHNRDLTYRKIIIESILRDLNLSYREDKRGFRIFSLVMDDGRNYGAGILLNFKTAVYSDFHTSGAVNFCKGFYNAFKDEFINIIKKHIEIKNDKNIKRITIETREELEELLLKYRDKKIFVKCECGFGKSLTIKKISDKYKTILLEPLKIQVEQESKNQNVNHAYLCENVKTKDFKNKKLIFTTYNQYHHFNKIFKEFENNCLFVVDEAHTLISDTFRSEIRTIIKTLENRNNYILMTATDDMTGLEEFVDIVIEQKKTKKENRFVRMDLNKGKKLDRVVNNIVRLYEQSGETKQTIFIDNKKDNEDLLNTLKNIGLKQTDMRVVNSDEKNNGVVDDIIVEYENKLSITITTRILSVGFHILNEGNHIYHIFGNDVNVIEQMVNRPRLDKARVEVILYGGEKTKEKTKDYNFIAKKCRESIYKNIKEYQKNIEKYENKKNLLLDSDLYNYILGNKWTAHQIAYKNIVKEQRNDIYYIMNKLIEAGFTKIDDISYEESKYIFNKTKNQINLKDKEMFEKYVKDAIKYYELDFDLDCKLDLWHNKLINNKELTNDIKYIITEMFKLNILNEEYIKKYSEWLENGKMRDIKINLTKLKEELQFKHRKEDKRVEEFYNIISNKIKEYSNNKEYLTSYDIKELVKITGIKKTKITKVLNEMGYKNKSIRIDGKVVRVYQL